MRLALVLALLATTSAAESADCRKSAEAYGAIMRASIFCNFPSTPAVERSGTLMRESCPSRTAARPGVEAGFKIFERERTRNGDAQACSSWDGFIKALSQ